MYLPDHFAEHRPAVLAQMMRAHPLAALVTLGADGLEANHVPLVYDAEPGPFGRLSGHLARGNRQWQDAREGVEALAIFQGPQAYVSPNWYPSKQENGRAVPTWNYVVVHARGRLVVHDDAVWLRRLVERLTDEHEAAMPAAWKVSDAPADYVDGLLKAIVGVELQVTSLEGKWKVSQNQPAGNRAGVAAGLEELAALLRDHDQKFQK